MTAPHGVLAIISKKIFEKDFPGAEPGAVLAVDRYNSSNKALAPLGDGAPLFLVTVRSAGPAKSADGAEGRGGAPPRSRHSRSEGPAKQEQLLLVGILEHLSQEGGAWVARKANAAPAADITDLVDKLRFTTGKGITAKPGALGMSLQTPRSLTEEDAGLLRAAAGGGAPAAKASAPGGSAIAGTGVRERMLAEVLADPDNDEPRMVYADWLMEQGDPRGELISSQCRLKAGIAYLSTRSDMRSRVSELLSEHTAEWIAPLSSRADCTFRRGFIEDIEAPAKSFLDGADTIMAREPVTRLKLTSCAKAHLKSLASAPWAPRLRALKLPGAVDDQGVALLAGSAGLAGLTRLNLSGCDVTSDGARAIASSHTLTRLEMLALTGNEVDDEGISLLASSPNLASCAALYLARNPFGDDGVLALAASPHLERLRRLGIDGTEVSELGLQALAESKHLTSLRRVEAQGIWPGQKTLELLRRRFQFDY